MVGVVLDGRYRVERPLARGGMSTVYTGTDLRLDRTVAIKVMAPALVGDPEFVGRFAREARSAARLSHINVVGVHDQGEDAGHVFLVMELVRGRTLRDLLREHGRLSPELALAICEPLLAALAAAHRAGVIHRDVKPENVLLSDDGVVKVADFGLARALADLSTTSDTSAVMGTAGYVAPEQVTRGATSPRTDVYSAGIVLFEMLTGSTPYSGDTALSVAYQHVHDDVPAPSDRYPGVPPELDRLVLRATRRRPASRPEDAAAFLAEVHDVRAATGLRRVAIPPRLPARGSAESRWRPAGPADDARTQAQQPAERSRLHDGDLARSERRTVPTPRPETPPQPTPAPTGPATATTPAPAGPAADDHRLRATTTLPTSPAPTADLHARRSAPDAPTAVHAVPVEGRRRDQQPARSDHVAADPEQAAVAARAAIAADLIARAPTERQRHRRRFLIGLATVLILTLAIAAGGWWLGSGRLTSVPKLTDLTTSEATTAAARAGDLRIVVAADRVHSETIPAGHIARTVPAVGHRLHRGAAITVALSAGPERFTMPGRLVGLPRAGADAALAPLPLRVGFQLAYDEHVAAGSVVRADPPAGTSMRRGEAVTVVISRGPVPFAVPDVTGQDVATATATLRRAGLVVTGTSRPSESTAAGAVTAIRPAAGTIAHRGDPVAVTISTGPAQVEVPDVHGMTVQDATELLQRNGFTVTVERAFGFSDHVLSQTPDGGDTVDHGASVTLLTL